MSQPTAAPSAQRSTPEEPECSVVEAMLDGLKRPKGESLTLKERVDGFHRFNAALRHPVNRVVGGVFTRFTVAMFVVPVVVYFAVFASLGPEATLFGMDRSGVAGSVAILTSLVIQARFVVWAIAHDAERDAAKLREKQE